MSWILATDLHDSLLQPLASTYLADVDDWIIEQADAVGVAEADILVTLGKRAKRAAVYQLAVLTCLGESGQNQHAFGGEGKDAFAVKLKFYQDQLTPLMGRLDASDWSGSTEESSQTPSNICPEIWRG
jgi:hypothetical protein